LLLQTVEVVADLLGRAGVIFFHGERQQFAGFGQARRQRIEDLDDFLEFGSLPAQRLGALGLAPHVGLFELTADFGESLGFAVVVKDTSSTRSCVRRDP